MFMPSTPRRLTGSGRSLFACLLVLLLRSVDAKCLVSASPCPWPYLGALRRPSEACGPKGGPKDGPKGGPKGGPMRTQRRTQRWTGVRSRARDNGTRLELRPWWRGEEGARRPGTELELELIQSHVAQKPVLRGEVGCACVAREVSVERGGMGEHGCARRLGGWVWVRSRLGRVCVCGVRGPLCCGAPPQGLCNAPHDSGHRRPIPAPRPLARPPQRLPQCPAPRP